MKRISLLLSCLFITFGYAQQDVLPSWEEGENKTSLLNFIYDAQDEASEGYIAPADRIAVFDNDGTLWAEKPTYVQVFYIFAQVKALAPQHPEWKEQQPFKAVLENDQATISKFGEKDLIKLMATTQTGMTEDEFEASVAEWLKTAKNPATGMLFTDMTYKPMNELLAAMRAAGFKTYIVSGGGLSFMRPWVESAYGIPREQVIGSRIEVVYEKGGVLRREPKINLIDDKAGKPVGIYQVIGKRPVFAFGNSDGDLDMLEYTTTGEGARMGFLLHHTDAKREWAYDRDSSVGKLDKGLDDYQAMGWKLVDMKNDWVVIYGDLD
ncbi:HAD family hydrolase [Kiritimatiellota bacterium B12222]|nr:HAD family hydrolase [Kiritimatiellota bacterium B12222]